jgi:predicted DNA-binding transcriptional regulator YafY
MRADRLVAVLMLLQTRGRVTAAEVADELEISERTARRDLDALSMAGLPVYSQPGRNGGWQLLGGARTDLSGLNAAEARALFLVAGPSPATPELRAALRKLVRALPEPFRADAQAASTAVVVDPSEWGRATPSRPLPQHLDALQRAVIEGEQLELGYVARDRASTTRIVHPLGLAAKGSVWYLVADTEAGLRTFRVDRVTSVAGNGERVIRPDGFDLAAAWRLISVEVDRLRAPIRVQAAARANAIPLLRWVLDTKLRVGPARDDGRIDVEVAGESIDAIAGQLAGFGARLEIFEPAEVRAALVKIAEELTATYGSGVDPRRSV